MPFLFGPLPTNASTEATLVKLLPAYKSVSFNNGAGRSDPSTTVPANKRWVVRCIRVTMQTSATVITRSMGVLTLDGANVISYAVAGVNQTASTLLGYMFAPSVPNAVALAGGQATVGYPEVVLAAGYSIATAVINRQAGDIITVVADVEEYSV